MLEELQLLNLANMNLKSFRKRRFLGFYFVLTLARAVLIAADPVCLQVYCAFRSEHFEILQVEVSELDCPLPFVCLLRELIKG